MDNDAYAKYNVPEKGNLPGTYTHESTNEKLEVTEHGQADALVRQGWKFEAPLRPAAERAAEAAKRQYEADVAAGLVKPSDTTSNNQKGK